MTFGRAAAVYGVLVTALSAPLASAADEVTAKFGASLIRDDREQLFLPVHFTIAPDWHLYWSNPGDGGMPPSVSLTLPDGWKAGPVRFPRPTVLRDENGTSYVYEKELMLLVPLEPPTPPSDTERTLPAILEISGRISWLVCKTACIGGKADARAVVEVPATPGNSPLGTAFPVASGAGAATLEPRDGGVRLNVSVVPPASGDVLFIPETCPGVDFGGTGPFPLAQGGSHFELALDLKITLADSPDRMPRVRGLVLFGSGRSEPSYSIDLPVPAAPGG